jgi:hypothetical protein
MGARIAGDDGAEIGIRNPVLQARAKNPGAQPALAGDDQNAARAGRALAQDELDQLAVSRVLRVPVQVQPGVDLGLSPSNAPLAGQVRRRSWAASRARLLPCPFLRRRGHRRRLWRRLDLLLGLDAPSRRQPHGARDTAPQPALFRRQAANHDGKLNRCS